MSKVENYASVWDALADTPEQAANLRARAELMQKIGARLKQHDWTQAEAARRCGVTQPRINDLLRGRVQVINLWRPINHPVYDAPLAVAEAGSVRADALVPSDLVYRHRVGETYNVLFNPAHRWHYLSEQRPDEVLLLKCYDSRDDVARFAPHTSFIVPDAPAGAPTRESIELRTLVFHKA